MESKTKHFGNIRRQLAISIIVVTAVLIGLIYLVNTQFLGRYYERYKQKALSAAFHTFSAAQEDGRLYSEDYRVEFERICSAENLQVIVMTSDSDVILSSQGETGLILSQLFRMLFENPEIIVSDSGYSVSKLTDERMGGEYLILWGTLPDDNTILIRTAVESINDSVRLSTRFLFIAGLVSIVISMIISNILSNYITRPVRELTDISKRMERLDFEARYKVRKRPNEIDALGERMNKMSDTLRDTIAALREANADLNRDLKVRSENEQMRRDFLSNVSHELKTPIALIRGYAEGLSDSVNDDEESRNFYCEVIMDEAERMNNIVMQLLSLNQLEFGERTLNQERIDLVELVKGVMERNRIRFEGNGITAHFDHDESCFIWSDELATEQVVTNYISNAINHCEGDRRIWVSITEEGGKARLSVFNTGSRIPTDAIPHLWDKFYKVDEARTREYGGSGIGLSIVKAIAESLGEECGVRNEKDGVTFWMTFDR